MVQTYGTGLLQGVWYRSGSCQPSEYLHVHIGCISAPVAAVALAQGDDWLCCFLRNKGLGPIKLPPQLDALVV